MFTYRQGSEYAVIVKALWQEGSMLDNNRLFLGIDVGSVSTNLVAIDEKESVVEKLYLRTMGQPIQVLLEGMGLLRSALGESAGILGVGATGSGRQLANVIVGADIVKNEITTHAVAAEKLVPGVRTILEIGGQDSKLILLKNGVVSDFAMNTVCAAGTGSFLDRQASRLGIPIDQLGTYALKAKTSVRIAGRCAVFAESDMIHKQQTGHSVEDIVSGLCQALVRNFLNNLAKGKSIEEPIVFQGGVAANIGIVQAFQKELGKTLVIPEHYDVMGAYGAALIAKKTKEHKHCITNFRGFDITQKEYKVRSIECQDCANACEIIEILTDGEVTARWGDRCGKWSQQIYIDKGV